MKLFTALLLIGFIAFSHGMTDEEMEMIKKMAVACMEETGVSQENAMKIKEGVFDSDPKMPEFLFCMFQKPGFMNEAGDYQVDTMKVMLGEKYGVDVAAKAVDGCIGFQGDKLQKAVHLAKCFHETKADM